MIHYPYDSPWFSNDSCFDSGFLSQCRIVHLAKGDLLYMQSDSLPNLYLVNKGRIQLNLSSEKGNIQTIFIATPGSLLGELSCFDGFPNICEAVAVTKSHVYEIPKTLFLEYLTKHPKCAIEVCKSLSLKMRILASQVEQLSFHDASQRVRRMLKILAAQFGESLVGSSIQLKIRFTHQEMADLTGLSRVAVSQVFSELHAESIISKSAGHIIINDINKL